MHPSTHTAGENQTDGKRMTARRFATALCALALASLFGAQPAVAQLPAPTSCQIDIDGANDVPNQSDLTQFCVDVGPSPWDLIAKVNWDEIGLSGANTADACLLLDSDDAGRNIDLAVCVSVVGDPFVPRSVLLFTCNDSAADHCAGAVLVEPTEYACVGGGVLDGTSCSEGADCASGSDIGSCEPAGPLDTACEVSKKADDPFPTGAAYMDDTEALCGVAFADFGKTGVTLVDACSNTSENPQSGVKDCVLFAACESAADCGDNNSCTTDACVSGVCSHTPNTGVSCDDELFCTAGDMCNDVGFCEGGGPTDCSSEDDQCNVGVCDEDNDECDATPVADNTVCNDSILCTVGDVCVSGTCTPGTPNDAQCSDGAFCNGDEVCTIAGCVAGTAPTTDDGVVCTDDSCDEVNDLVLNTANNANCDNGQFCDGAETCDALLDCQAGTAPTTTDGVACTDDSCDEVNDVVVNTANNANCDDTLFCNGDETCDAVLDCQAGTAPTTDDGVGCTDDSCDETNDVVVNTANNANCDNGQFCDGDETCDALLDCQAGTAPTTTDGVACTDDSCDEVNDVIVNTPNDGNCDNGQFCDGSETCDALLDCQAGTAPTTDDGVTCTDDSCDEVNDVVVNSPNDGSCSDGLFCNGAEICDPTTDCGPGTPVDPDDGIACTTDSCDEDNDMVVNSPDDVVCDDALACTGDEVCDLALGCTSPNPIDPDDGVGCTDDSCEEADNADGYVIVNDPNDFNCDQTEGACTLPDTCDPFAGCEPNNIQCGAVTDSSLCTFDISPKGVCVLDGTPTGEACDTSGPDNCDSGVCMEENQFRLLFTPAADAPASKLNASNPGQFFYNAREMVDGPCIDESETFNIEIPYPFVTVGGMPVHVYDGALVGEGTVDGAIHPESCFVPPAETIADFPIMVSLADWAAGTSNGTIDCDVVPAPPHVAPAFCRFSVTVDYPESCELYINVHLDFGLKGGHLDVNPADGVEDRYTKGTDVSPWDSADAIVHVSPYPVGIEDCQDLTFSHTTVVTTDPFYDTVQNLNDFKKFVGVFGRVTDAGGGVTGAIVNLIHPKDGEVATVVTGADGFYVMDYKHKGKLTEYAIEVEGFEAFPGAVMLKANGNAEANFDQDSATWSYN